MTKARNIMTSPVHTLDKGDTLLDAAKQLAKHDVGAMPVLDGETCCCIITDRDIVVSGLAAGKDPNTCTVGEIGTQNVFVVDVDDDARAVAEQMGQKQIRRAPVAEKGKIVGMIAQADVARRLDDEEAGDMLGEISK